MFLEEKRKKELSEANAREQSTDTKVISSELYQQWQVTTSSLNC